MPEQSDTTSRADTYVSVFSRSFLQQRRPLLRMTDADGTNNLSFRSGAPDLAARRRERRPSEFSRNEFCHSTLKFGNLRCLAGDTGAVITRVVGTGHPRPSLLSCALKSLLTSALQSEGAASATATHSQIQSPVWNINIGNGCSLNSKMLLQIQQTFECV